MSVSLPEIKLASPRTKVIYYQMRHLKDVVPHPDWEKKMKIECFVTRRRSRRNFVFHNFQPLILRKDIVLLARWTKNMFALREKCLHF